MFSSCDYVLYTSSIQINFTDMTHLKTFAQMLNLKYKCCALDFEAMFSIWTCTANKHCMNTNIMNTWVLFSESYSFKSVWIHPMNEFPLCPGAFS